MSIHTRRLPDWMKTPLPSGNDYIEEFVKPAIFIHYREAALSKGFSMVESSPLVRSSYHAERHIYA